MLSVFQLICIENSEEMLCVWAFSKEFAAKLASAIDPNNTRRDIAEYLIDEFVDTTDSSIYTYRANGNAANTHISIISPADDMVSLTL